MLYVKSRNSFKVRRQKKILLLCRVPKKSTRQTMTLPCALVLPCVFLSTLGKNYVCRVPVNLHTANYGAHGKIEVSGSVGVTNPDKRSLHVIVQKGVILY